MNVECPHCKAAIQVPVSNAGEKASCPYCTGEFILPSPGPYTPDANVTAGSYLQAPPDYKVFAEKKVLAGIMGVLFGAFGVHKFILGLKSAKIMLMISIASIILGSCLLFPTLVVFGMSLVGMIEGIIYLTKSDQEFYQTYGVERRQWF